MVIIRLFDRPVPLLLGFSSQGEAVRPLRSLFVLGLAGWLSLSSFGSGW